MTREEKENLLIRGMLFYEIIRSAKNNQDNASIEPDDVELAIHFTLDKEFDLGNIHIKRNTDEEL